MRGHTLRLALPAADPFNTGLAALTMARRMFIDLSPLLGSIPLPGGCPCLYSAQCHSKCKLALCCTTNVVSFLHRVSIFSGACTHIGIWLAGCLLNDSPECDMPSGIALIKSFQSNFLCPDAKISLSGAMDTLHVFNSHGQETLSWWVDGVYQTGQPPLSHGPGADLGGKRPQTGPAFKWSRYCPMAQTLT